MNIQHANEYMLSEIATVLQEKYEFLDVNDVKNKLSVVFVNYQVSRVENEVNSHDLKEKTQLFIDAMRLEGLSPNTIEGYELELRLLARRVKKPVRKITTDDIRAYLSSLEHIKSSTLGKKMSAFRSFFKWLESEEIITKNPMVKIRRPKEQKKLPKALTVEELELLRESCKTLRERALIEFFYSTGSRLDEIQRLNKSDIDWQNLSTVVFGKGSKEREVYISFKAKYHLKKYLGNRTDDVEALFVTETNPRRRLGADAMQDAVRKIAVRSGIEKKITPHVMRHTFATLTLNNGADITVVQHLLGHSSPQTTLRYTNLSEERKRETHKKFHVQ